MHPVFISLVSAKKVPAAVGVKEGESARSNIPPAAASYQSTVSPAPTVTLKAGIVSPSQILKSPLLTGGAKSAQSQLGAVIMKSSEQVVVELPAVIIKSLLTSIPEIVNDPPPLSTILPSLTIILSVSVNKTFTVKVKRSAAQSV